MDPVAPSRVTREPEDALTSAGKSSESRAGDQEADEHEAWTRAVTDEAPALLWLADHAGDRTHHNRAWCAFTGLAADAARGHGWLAQVPSEDHARHRALVDAALTSHAAYESEYRLRRHDGQLRWMRERAVVRYGRSGAFLGHFGTCEDVTEARALEQALEGATEAVRLRVGQDLHDGIGQVLTGIAFLAKALAEGASGAQADAARRLLALTGEATAQVKTLARGLSPLHVEARSLVELLVELAADTARLYRVACVFHGDPLALDATDDTLGTRTQLYMIAREAIINAVRHGRATAIELRLGRAGGRRELSIVDDGEGFALAPTSPGLGLPSMRARARTLGGELDVTPHAPRGVLVRCRW